jgi:hypothetical protein
MKVVIQYFKMSGKWYTDDEDVEWPEDKNHYTGWKPFEDVVRLKDMFAVCMESPLGYPQFCWPQQAEALGRAEMLANQKRRGTQGCTCSGVISHEEGCKHWSMPL